MYERFAQENKVANEIMFLRKGGSIDQAISMCLEAVSYTHLTLPTIA